MRKSLPGTGELRSSMPQPLPGTGELRSATETRLPARRESFFARKPPLLLGIVGPMTESMRRTQVALNLPDEVPALLSAVEVILQAMTENPSFPSPTPSLASVAVALAALRDAEVTSLTRTRGTVATRNEKRAALLSVLKRLKAYVQGVADDDPDHAAGIIEGAGMSVWKAGAGPKPPFDVKAGTLPGTVRVVVRAIGKDASYEWAWSADGGKTWQAGPATLQAKVVLEGLPPGVTCLFRYRAVTRKSASDWSEPVPFRVP
jgi:hypothetical protein